MPKTGGTFVTEVPTRLHRPDEDGAIPYGPISNIEPKHGTCREVPEEHQNKPIISCMRSPYEWYVSQYEFSWWKRTFLYHPELYPTPAGSAIEQALPEFVKAHPVFPEIGFEEFLELCCRASLCFQHEPSLDVGLYTKSCIAFYFREPAVALRNLDKSYMSSHAYQSDMFDVRFIRTAQVAAELRAVLLTMDYQSADLEFISTLGKILPDGRGRSDDQHWEKYYSKRTRDLIRQKDWAIFEMFPDYDVSFS